MAGRRRRRGREVNGVLLLDKPQGQSSNEALQYVKRVFKAAKAGHTGSLDPLASGMLPLCFGEATKISAFLLDADKHYQTRCRLGVKTDTGDADGTVIDEQSLPELSEQRTRSVLRQFVGELQQVPPMYSAVKYQGRRLYELAREGVVVERQPRRIEVHALELVAFNGDELELSVHCSKGTYVRTLIEEIAEALGTIGHVTALRRECVGPYQGEEMVTVAEIEKHAEDFDSLDALLKPIDSAVSHWPTLEVGRDAAYYLQQGQPVQVARAPRRGRVRLYATDSRFLGIGEVQIDGRVAPKRLIRTGSGG